MKPTNESYFSKEVRSEYLSNSQIKDFCGTLARKGCEARAMATSKGEWSFTPSADMLIGSYVDEYFTGDLEKFKFEHPEIFKKDGELLAKFSHANEIIKYAENDELFMKFMKGEYQRVLIGEIYGQKFIGKVDVMHGELINDLKIMKDMESIWSDQCRSKVNFVDAWGLPDQLAIYQELEFQMTGVKKDCYLSVLTKEKQPDKAIIYIPQMRLDASLMSLEDKVTRIVELKAGKADPICCETCDYCKSTKELKEVTNYNDLVQY